ncbi:host-nuclease inhibitor Gam family protein [Gracilibacillus thailandensis]|uniref:Nuclease inhibitor protein n=1 Tax=Gracilibacillus thailandensis TaxID=563735 RepID=A0A6N7QWM2_9BACI|nr:host-nuclease inhibitor Gam family protein [Gracilibacillus thailandensis]MRI65120.1 hypothetical protein [Gracilibacillus thailandensis]
MELQEYLDQEEQVNESFQIDNDQTANWALRKIKDITQQIQNNSELAQAEIEKIESWEQQEKEKLQQSIDYFQGLLAQYAVKKREEDPKFKSQKLPHGKIGFRKKPAKWNYDKDKIIDSLTKNNMQDFIKVTYKPDIAGIKSLFDVQDGKVFNPETGEVIEGITVEEQGEDFTVKVDD